MKNKIGLITFIMLGCVQLLNFPAHATLISKGVKTFIIEPDPLLERLENVLPLKEPTETAEIDRSLFKDFGQALLLGDGGDWALELFDYKEKYLDNNATSKDSLRLSLWGLPHARIFSTDLEVEDERQLGKVTRMKIDNTESLPFEENLFDVILMRQGLCHAQTNGRACGGICADNAQEFLEEVVKVLNKNNPNSFAYLDGPTSTSMPSYDNPNIKLVECQIEMFENVTRYLQKLEASAERLAEQFPNLSIKLIYSGVKEARFRNSLDQLEAELERRKGSEATLMSFRGILIEPKHSSIQ